VVSLSHRNTTITEDSLTVGQPPYKKTNISNNNTSINISTCNQAWKVAEVKAVTITVVEIQVVMSNSRYYQSSIPISIGIDKAN
jgi:hypothetical protein